MFHKVVSVHINRSAYEIFKIYLFIEIFSILTLFMLQESPGDFSSGYKLKKFYET